MGDMNWLWSRQNVGQREIMSCTLNPFHLREPSFYEQA